MAIEIWETSAGHDSERNETTWMVCEEEGGDMVADLTGVADAERKVHLIAAAPDMLEALEGIYVDDDGDGYISAEGMAEIAVLIAKARGK